MRTYETLALLRIKRYPRNRCRFVHPGGWVGFRHHGIIEWYLYDAGLGGWWQTGSSRGSKGARMIRDGE